MRGWILAVACPFCGSARGRSCRTRIGGHVRDTPHRERVEALREVEKLYNTEAAAAAVQESDDGPYVCSGHGYHLPACGGTCGTYEEDL